MVFSSYEIALISWGFYSWESSTKWRFAGKKLNFDRLFAQNTLISAKFREIPQKSPSKAPQTAPMEGAFPKGARRTSGLRQPKVQKATWLETEVKLWQKSPKNPAILKRPAVDSCQRNTSECHGRIQK